MLSKKEKQELLKDGLSLKRKEEFNHERNRDLKGTVSLDEYIRFLKSIQKIFSSFAILRKSTIVKYNKL